MTKAKIVVTDAMSCPRECGASFAAATDAIRDEFIVDHLEVVHGERLPDRPPRRAGRKANWTYADLLAYARGQTQLRKDQAEARKATSPTALRRMQNPPRRRR